MEPLVSVIIPVYNVRDYLERCLDSVLSQTYGNLEVIVVDDGSTDGSGSVCDAYASKDDRIRVIHQDNSGISSARNAALDVATGIWIAFVDGDDFIHRQSIEIMLGASDGENDIVMGSFLRVNGTDNVPFYEFDIAHTKKSVLSGKRCLDNMFTLTGDSGIPFLVVWNKLYPAALLKDIRFGDHYGIEDQLFNTVLYQKAGNVFVLDAELYFYLVREGSITYENSCKMWYSQVRGFMEMFSLVPAEETVIRGHLLKKMYNKMLTCSFFLRGTDLSAASRADNKECFRETRREYFSSPAIRWKDRVVFLTLWVCPPLLDLLMYLSGNRRQCK